LVPAGDKLFPLPPLGTPLGDALHSFGPPTLAPYSPSTMARLNAVARVAVVATAAAAVVAAATPRAVAAADLFPQTPDEYANFVLSSMNESVSPCDDAYKWACDGWIAANPLPPHKDSVSRFYGAMKQRMQDALHPLLTTAPLVNTKAGMFYYDCIADRDNDLSVLRRFGPTLRALVTSGSYESVVTATAVLHSNSGGTPLFELDVSDSREKYGEVLLELDRPGLGTSRDGFRGRTPHWRAVQTAYKVMVASFVTLAGDAGLLGGAASDGLTGAGWATAEEAAEAVYALEERIQKWKTAGYKAYKANDAQPKYNMMPLATSPDLEFPAAMLATLQVAAPKGAALVKYPVYFRELNAWLKTAVVGNQDKGRAVLQAYLAYKATREFARAELLGPSATAVYWAYRMVVKQTSRPTPRRARCFTRVAKRFPIAISGALIDNFLSADKIAFARGIAKDIGVAHGELMAASKWMDAPTKAAAQKKLDSMDAFVADNTPNDKEDDASDIDVTRGDYVSTFLSADLHAWRAQWHRLTGRAAHLVTLRNWETNARHNSHRTEYYIPAAILQTPAFNPAAPHALTLGGVGRVMGHELNHAFDSRNRNYDDQGLLVDWWSPAARAAYDEHAQCLVDLYDTYVPPDLPCSHVRGKKTVRENQADAGGIRSAWRVWQARKAAGATGPDNAVLSAKFTPDQLLSALRKHGAACSRWRSSATSSSRTATRRGSFAWRAPSPSSHRLPPRSTARRARGTTRPSGASCGEERVGVREEDFARVAIVSRARRARSWCAGAP